MKLERVNSELKRELSVLISYGLKDPRIDSASIGVMRVDTTKDLKYAKVYVTITQTETPKEILKLLQNSASFLRGELFKRLRVRAVPELTFIVDDSLDYAARIEQIIKDINSGS